MASITINEISQNYSYAIGTNSYACVAFPITASWGPCLSLADAEDDTPIEDVLEDVKWYRFAATQSGLESFVSTYRGASSVYRLAKDYSYQMAMTLMSAGYDVLVCRVCPGAKAQSTIQISGYDYALTAKYPGTFGNSLMIKVKENTTKHYVNIITYVIDSTGIKTAVENITCTVEEEYSTDSILYIDEVDSNFLDFALCTTTGEGDEGTTTLTGGTDVAYAEDGTDADTFLSQAIEYATQRYTLAGYDGLTFDSADSTQYITALNTLASTKTTATNKVIDDLSGQIIAYREQIFLYAMYAYDLLQDKLAYNHNRVISPGWDDQDYLFINNESVATMTEISPFHMKLMDSAYVSRCATAYLDIPRSLKRSGVYNETEVDEEAGYAQLLSRYLPVDEDNEVNGTLFSTHSALFAPWGQYKYTSTTKKNIAPPSFQALMIQRAMILNQSIQYEWALPTNRTHTLNLGTLDYHISKKLLDEWQKTEGVGVNCITAIPDLGTALWGNSTLYEVPPATYQALANLSSRLLVNAIEDVVWRCGVGITFRYNNSDAYDAFYAGVTPILDTMKNVGAIVDYKVVVNGDLNGYDQVDYNSIVGKIYLLVYGVINDITVDLVALPPTEDLSNYD